MNRRGLLKGMMALPVASALGCRADNNKKDEASKVPDKEKGTLKVVLNGAFAIVIQKNARNRLRVFSPKELSNLHDFYFNDPSHPRDKTKTQNFELLPDGLEVSRTPVVDEKLAAFNLPTDLWCQDEYFVTIDLPAPQKISSTLLHSAIFASGKPVHIPSNLVLEYGITDLARVRMLSADMKDTVPLQLADLYKRYEKACSERRDKASKDQCEEMKKHYEAALHGSAVGYFFGVGLDHDDPRHAIDFFNNRILVSFPHLAKVLALRSVDDPYGHRKQTEITSPRLVSAVWQPEVQEPKLLQVASVVDCLISGPIITHPISSGG